MTTASSTCQAERHDFCCTNGCGCGCHEIILVELTTCDVCGKKVNPNKAHVGHVNEDCTTFQLRHRACAR
jgi:hypothetical protein